MKLKRIKLFLSIVFAILDIRYAHAQLCQGSLGDPVVNITFGSGSTPGQPLGSSITNYTFAASGCPNDGLYTIANSTSGCFNGTWHNLAEDHTPNDVNGYMMIVNASYNPGDFFVNTVNNLCGGTTYEFAAWILNIQKPNACGGNPIKPNVTFNIETTTGTVLLSYKTGDIPSTTSPVWKQYGSYFSTPPGITDVVIRMTNNAPGGCGNDLVLDDITFRPCGPQVSVSIGGNSNVKEVCFGDTTSTDFVGKISSSYSNPFYQWQESKDNGNTWSDISGATSSTYKRQGGSAAGVFLYRLTVAQGSNITIPTCRIASNIITININSLPVPSVSNTGPKCESESISLSANNGSTYRWSGPANFTSNVQSPVINNVSVNNSGKYYVTVTSDKGCINIDSTSVVINKNPIASAGTDKTICEGKSVVLNGSGTNATNYKWTPSTGLSADNIPGPTASPIDTTLYVLTVTNGNCTYADSVIINVLKKPIANAGPDKKIIEGQSIILNGSVGGGNVSFYWTPNYSITTDTTLNPIVAPVADTTYALHVTSLYNCGTATDDVFVRVYKKIVIPNAFSPNNDGVNDTWNIAALETYPTAELSVYNRYGQLVFYNEGNSKHWDGTFHSKPLPVGTYYYLLDLKNGSPVTSGSILLLR